MWNLSVEQVQKQSHELAKKKGWWPGYKSPDDIGRRNLAEALALIHAEVSEALEELRNCDGDKQWPSQTRQDKTGKPLGLPIELADIIIRVADMAEALGINLSAAIIAKHAYNETRPNRHARQF